MQLKKAKFSKRSRWAKFERKGPWHYRKAYWVGKRFHEAHDIFTDLELVEIRSSTCMC